MDSQGPRDRDGSEIKLAIKFSGSTIPVEIAANSTIKDLKILLQTLTNVLPRGQKLIFKGKVLSDELTLASSGISDGSKIMLMASHGLHQGDGFVKRETQVLPGVKGGKKEEPVTKSQLERWKATGVIALSNSHLSIIPEEVWACGQSTRVLDLSFNSLLEVPAAIGRLTSIQKLLLSGNHFSDESICWEGLSSLKSLVALSLNQNNLTSLPSSLGALTCLKQLHIESNKLTCIPTEIGFLKELQVLNAQSNRLKTIPPSIGGCVSLVEVDLSCNLLAELPEAFGNLRNLKALYLRNNGLKSLPKTLFKMCLQLSILDLHGTSITLELLREFEGWESFDERRRLKHQKQLEFGVAGSAKFDEGADKDW
ncbi:lrr repeats and ubiquitin-like domain-containing protein at2g30105 [Phtheirospermum japonicum]|uniref:Lrr repeats and ubiquitin-like domain-containing protein at2g30105 n=1 Tax=Phtheirospermum japonicum TaxID=374723 RepID=A0A830BTE3_9LAMI|nr:lrr repeats and ubiquitin-like domain-containing protein at2g30105 [Phtheirospermum japonicum]